ncbi:hypothetical protein KCU95_g28, partial [Aureobasidium melanogenum]
MNSNDITAVILNHGNRNILLASIYIPNIGNGYESDEQELHSRLQEVHEAIMRERNNNSELEVFIAGDFNRHDTIGGGNEDTRLHRGKQPAASHPERSSNMGTEWISFNN